MPSSFDFMIKNDRRRQWKILKTEHAFVANGVNFDLKLGPALDKYQTQVNAIADASKKANLKPAQLDPLLAATAPLKPIVAGYQTQVAKLGEPARSNFLGLLKAITEDIKSWEQLAAALKQAGPAPVPITPAQQAAAENVAPTLDQMRQMCVMLVQRGTRAREVYQNKIHEEGMILSSQLVESARLAGPACHDLANMAVKVSNGTNYELFKARAKAALHLISNTKAAADAFYASWKLISKKSVKITDSDARALAEAHVSIESDFGNSITILTNLP